MAEVRHCFGRGAYEFAHKLYNRSLLESRNKQGISTIQASCLSVGFLSGHIKNDELYEAESKVTRGVPRICYTSVPVLGVLNYVCGKGNDLRLKHYSLYNNTQGQNIGIHSPRCWSKAKFGRTFCTSSPLSRRLCWGHGQFVFVREFGDNWTRDEPLYKTKTGYYEILQVLPSATQAQIKTAYYKQSFVYHPDRNAGSEEANVRFSEISEAYTVLGNKSLRKKYDLGLLSQADLVGTGRPSSKDGATGSSAKQQAERRRPVAGTEIREGVFDFDQFFKSHYSEQLQRQRDIRVRKEEMQRKEEEAMSDKKLGKVTEMGVWVLVLMAVGIVINLKRG